VNKKTGVGKVGGDIDFSIRKNRQEGIPDGS
jgi:hypothetical protein